MKKSELRKIIKEEIQRILEDNVSFFIDKFKRKMRGSSKGEAAEWIDGIGEINDDEKRKIWKKIQPYLDDYDDKTSLPSWIK